MKSSFVKLNHVSTLSGKGQIIIFVFDPKGNSEHYRKYFTPHKPP